MKSYADEIRLPNTEGCFFCGKEGLSLKLFLNLKEKEVYCEFSLDRKYQGFENMVHGGIITGILDEVMWWRLFIENGTVTATGQIEVEFKSPIFCERKYRALSKEVKGYGKRYVVLSIIEDENKRLCAKAKGTFVKIKQFGKRELLERMDIQSLQNREAFLSLILAENLDESEF